MSGQRYFGDWAADAPYEDKRGYAGLLADFAIDSSVVKDEEILYAAYTYESYSGSALVLYERDGRPYEVHGGHCSCYGLEGQWEPEETSWEALRMREFSEHVYNPADIAPLIALVQSRLGVVA